MGTKSRSGSYPGQKGGPTLSFFGTQGSDMGGLTGLELWEQLMLLMWRISKPEFATAWETLRSYVALGIVYVAARHEKKDHETDTTKVLFWLAGIAQAIFPKLSGTAETVGLLFAAATHSSSSLNAIRRFAEEVEHMKGPSDVGFTGPSTQSDWEAVLYHAKRVREISEQTAQKAVEQIFTPW